jgi:phytoene dehydrogenase-like protein
VLKQNNYYDVVIIGAGMSGLAAGIRLAYYDKKVLICEQHGVLGGLNSYYKKAGRILDVGLHAMTNYVSKKERLAPLNKLVRQLKLKWEDFCLVPQNHSVIHFPDSKLIFSNDPELLMEEIRKKFPSQIDGYNRLVKYIYNYDALSLGNSSYRSARKVMAEFIDEPLLIEMLLCPLMYYGSAWENDMDFSQFCIMFRSIYLEGFARPIDGVTRIIDLLKEKYLACNGDLRFGCEIKKIMLKNDEAVGVKLGDGQEIVCGKIISSAGLHETEKLLGRKITKEGTLPGELAFFEVILCLKNYLSDDDYKSTIMFYNNSEKFKYRKSDDFVSIDSGVICSPDNFEYGDEKRTQPILRLTNIANYEKWNKCSREDYKKKKDEWLDRIIDNAASMVPIKKENIDFVDMFTPTTVRKFTGHINGAVYGSPHKVKDGATSVKNLYICGTDQGFLGIVGSMLSGVSMANVHCLQE